MKDGQIIAAAEAKVLIDTYGVGYTMLNGAQAEKMSLDDIDDSDAFKVVINYGHPVQLHLVDSYFRCSFELEGLRGRAEGGEWVA